MDLGLTEKVIFITGGSSGIGKATALALSKEAGIKIAISYFSNQQNAADAVKEMEHNGAQAIAVYLNLADHDSIEKAVTTITKKWSSIDGLINNAVQWGNHEHRGKFFHEIPLTAWQEVVGTNLYGTVRLTQLVVPYMQRSNWGRIVNISSDLAFDSMKGSGAYSTLKASLIGLTANLVEEYSRFNILSNVVLPSWTLTERARKFFPESFRENVKAAYPTGRITVPEDVASTVAYLCSAANGHVNGETIRVTGKASMALVNYLFAQNR